MNDRRFQQSEKGTEMHSQHELAEKWSQASDAMWKALQRWLKRPSEQNYRNFHETANACSLARARLMAGVYLKNHAAL